MELPLRIDKKSGIPVYIQLEERIRLLVHGGRLRPGDLLPTVRSLAVDLKLNANTVARVYRDLQKEGVLELRRGIGTFVAETAGQPIETEAFAAFSNRVDELIEIGRSLGLSAKEISQLIQARWKEPHDAQR
ncbi:MAG: GntR family transcriptional regulator [Planctomycetota bacterium]